MNMQTANINKRIKIANQLILIPGNMYAKGTEYHSTGFKQT